MIGRRVKTLAQIKKPGDYCGPITGYSGDKPAVFFLLPNGKPMPSSARGAYRRHYLHHVVAPPHVFTEQADGSLQIRESIGAEPEWHGFLDTGHVWRGVGQWAGT